MILLLFFFAGETDKIIGGKESNVKVVGALYLKGNNDVMRKH